MRSRHLPRFNSEWDTAHKIIKALREQADLTSVFTLDKSLHAAARMVAMPQF
jgi:hypothetical protein